MAHPDERDKPKRFVPGKAMLTCLCVRDGAGEAAESACCDAMFANPQCQEVAERLGRAESE